MSQSKNKKKKYNKNCAGILGYEDGTENFSYDCGGNDGCCLSETEIRDLIREAVREGQGYNFFKANSRELWKGNDDINNLKDKWEELGNSDGSYDHFIRNGKNNAVYYGRDENDEWYDKNGNATNQDIDFKTGRKNEKLNTGISGRLGRKLGMAGVRAQIPFRMAAEPVYKAGREFRKIVEESVNELFDKVFTQKLRDNFLKSDENKRLRDRLIRCEMKRYLQFCKENNIQPPYNKANIDKLMMSKRGREIANEYVDWCEDNYITPATTKSMTYEKDLRDAWLIHFSDNAEKIWREGFTHAEADVDSIAYTDSMDNEGLCFAYPVEDGTEQYFTHSKTGKPNYGSEAVLFQANAVQLYNDGDEESQAVFYNNSARNLIYIKRIKNSNWAIASNRSNSEILYKNPDIGKVIDRAIANFAQYRKLMTNPWEHEITNSRMMNGVYGHKKRR